MGLSMAGQRSRPNGSLQRWLLAALHLAALAATRGSAPVDYRSRIPGSRLSTAEEVRTFRDYLHCVSARGRWVYDPEPRLLPWPYGGAESDAYRICDQRHTQANPDNVFIGRADWVAKRGNRFGHLWRVRPGLKYVWEVPAGACGEKEVNLYHPPLEDVCRTLSVSNSSRRQAAVGAGIQIPSGGGVGGANVVSRWLVGSKSAVPGSGNGSSNAAGGPAPNGSSGGIDPTATRDPASSVMIVFVGDSMSRSMALSFLSIALMGNKRLEHVPKEGLPCAPVLVPGFPDMMFCYGKRFACAGTPGKKIAIGFVRNDRLLVRGTNDVPYGFLTWFPLAAEGEGGGAAGAKPGGPSVLDKFMGNDVKGGVVEKRSLQKVFVLNRGAHYTAENEFFPQLNDTLSTLRSACPDCLIVFRNTAAYHKGCENITGLLSAPPDESSLPFNYDKILRQTREVRKMVENVGGVYLDIVPMTSVRGDEHLGDRGKSNIDCLHYCMPGPVDWWNYLLLHALQKLL